MLQNLKSYMYELMFLVDPKRFVRWIGKNVVILSLLQFLVKTQNQYKMKNFELIYATLIYVTAYH